MEILDIKEGFPDIGDHMMHNHIDYLSSGSVMLWFHRLEPDLTALINVHVYLLEASMKSADVELDPFFPNIDTFSIERQAVLGRSKNLLNIAFTKGHISFLFERAFHVTSARPGPGAPRTITGAA
ncbi:hypothetical protein [Taklimakanibacter albus]|uniref:Uncharacterized protein n=1 Tax=Taklimakanibacter albus TaxID=2800327 RepID=A0ACC5RBD0_9HYPH|nr:hypothetical protein [Aestuariivirga sp. YIM B02566]MBK1869949.1 hypothetical protein [Aestuariivirga sp. YIM B02566]